MMLSKLNTKSRMACEQCLKAEVVELEVVEASNYVRERKHRSPIIERSLFSSYEFDCINIAL